MKKIYLLITFLFCNIYLFGQTCKTPTGVSIACERLTETYDSTEIAAGNAYYDSLINANNWSSYRIGDCSTIYNCHGYAWHMSDGGDTLRIPYDSDVAKYYSGVNPTYREVGSSGKYRKVYYNGAQHSAIVDSDYTNWFISKWGNGPLVRHYPNQCIYNLYYNYTLEFYELKIDNLPNSVAEGCATDVSTLDINGASYNWSGDNTYVCASGNTYTGEVTGLDETQGSGEVKVEITSPYSNTTVKGIKSFSVTSAPSNPYISGQTLVCSDGESFTLHNVPTGNTITWSSSSNLSTSDAHANPCTFVSTGNGSGWVKATVSTACDESTFPIDQYDVWSGAPVISSISGPTSTPNGQWATYHAVLDNELSGATDYNWVLNPLNGNSVYDYGDDVDIAFYNSGSYQLLVQALNTCSNPNFGPYYGTSLYVYDSRSLLFTPNPTSGETLLTIESTGKEGQFDENSNWDLEIYNNSQMLKEKKTKMKGKEYKFNTSDWEEGVYMVRVKYKDKILTGKLVVKK